LQDERGVDGNRMDWGKASEKACTFSPALDILFWEIFIAIIANLKLYICRFQEIKLIFS